MFLSAFSEEINIDVMRREYNMFSQNLNEINQKELITLILRNESSPVMCSEKVSKLVSRWMTFRKLRISSRTHIRTHSEGTNRIQLQYYPTYRPLYHLHSIPQDPLAFWFFAIV